MNNRLLSYPFALPPIWGKLLEVASGIFWLRMPLPFALNHVNLWLVKEEKSYTIIDTGINSPEIKNLWKKIVIEELAGKWPEKLLVTHFHPDHAGLAGWLVKKGTMDFLMPRIEYFQAKCLQMDISDQLATTWKNYYRFCGVPNNLASQFFLRLRYHSLVTPLPSVFQAIEPKQEIQLGEYNFTINCYAGHSVGMACLYDSSRKILIAADQLLPQISPNVSVFAPEPRANPLLQYLNGLQDFFTLPDDVLVLPSHGLPFYGGASRAKEIYKHHQERLAEIIAYTKKASSIFHITQQLFKRSLDAQQMNFALGETLAHVNYLLENKQLSVVSASSLKHQLKVIAV